MNEQGPNGVARELSAAVMLSLLIAFVPHGQVLGWTALLAGLFTVVLLAKQHHHVLNILVLAFALRALTALVHYYVIPLPIPHDDAIQFESLGWEWAQQGLGTVLTNPRSGSYFYPWLISLVYAAVGRSPLMIQAVNVFLGTLVVYYTYIISKNLWSHQIGEKVAFIAAIYPTLVFYSSLTFREAPFVLAVLGGTYHLIRWYHDHSIDDLLLVLLAYTVATSFHIGAIAALLGALVLTTFETLRSLLAFRFTSLIKTSFSLGGILAVVGGFLAIGWGFGKFGVPVFEVDFRTIVELQTARARGRAEYPSFLINTGGWLELALQTPIRMLYFLFAPFPWMMRTAKDLIGILDGMVMFVLTMLAVTGRTFYSSRRAGNGVLLILLFLVVIFATGTSNYGTAIRHRAKLLPLFLCLIPTAHFILRLNAADSQARSSSSDNSESRKS